MALTHTHTKTYTVMEPWASTLPWECLVRPTGCVSPGHDHSPMVGDKCAAPQCDEELREGEECYAVLEVDGWVCWRHVDPDGGPV